MSDIEKPTHLKSQSIPDSFILCGGLGTRIRSTLGDTPKALAPVGNVPFLERLVRELLLSGCQRVILGTGFGADKIRQWLDASNLGSRVQLSQESSPRGTAGAIRNALDLLREDTILAMNGDSFVPGLSLQDFISQHYAHGLPTSLVVVRPDEREDAGSVVVDHQGRVAEFAEKQRRADARYISAGIYLLSRSFIARLPHDRTVSMEYEAMPSWLSSGIYAYRSEGALFDIGTPERLAHAQTEAALMQLGRR